MGPAYDCAVGKGWYGVMGIFCDHRNGLALAAVPGEEGGVTLRRQSGLGPAEKFLRRYQNTTYIENRFR